jgi:hypothetical protein
MDSKKAAKIFVDMSVGGMELLAERLMSLTPEEERRMKLRLVAGHIKILQQIEDELVKRGVKKERSE